MATINEMQIGWSQQEIEDCIVRYQIKSLGSEFERMGEPDMLCRVGQDNLQMHQTVWGGEARQAKITHGDIVYLEPGTYIKRYAGTMVRMIFFGKPSCCRQEVVRVEYRGSEPCN